MAHPNEELLRSGYEAFAKGDVEAVLAVFDPDIKWHISGRNAIAGDYRGHQEVLGFFGKLAELTGGTFEMEIHDIVANDEHAVAMVRGRAERNGRVLDSGAVHVWHVAGGKLTELWGTSKDPYADDEFFS